MNKPDDTSRIADNPSVKRMSAVLPLVGMVKAITSVVKRFGSTSETLDRIRQSAVDVLRQSDVLELPDRFNDAFGDQGWIATQSFGVEAMRRALDLHGEGRLEDAEREILAWFDEDNINLLAINRSKPFDTTGQRWYQLREALRLTLEERYWAAVPLILIACDGLASEILGSSPFNKEDADLTVFDSVAGHPTSLSALIAKVKKGVRKSTSDEMTLPLRHGTLHGRSLGYANRVVCMKAWLLMVALVDWACDRATEEQRRREYQSVQKRGWSEISEQMQKTHADRRAMEAYEPRSNTGPFGMDMDPDLPEFAILEFLTYWQAENYGHMAKRAVNLVGKPVSKLAGDLRATGELAHLMRFDLREVRQPSVAMAEANVYMEGAVRNDTVHGLFRVRASRTTEDGDPGWWYVQQSCMVELFQGRTIGDASPS